ncbi:MAG: AMP-binding protein [Candidatus Bathyarchaeota archaeon]|nr:AMP-binding protein [Candidatus Bathyarchaeota archaeon]MDH5787282.1 AMP-binding protein [Candidatus Bathyarchaeota archaeon]
MAWLNLGEILSTHARKYPTKLAVKDWRGRSHTYSELDIRTNKLANGLLNMGLRKGDRVAVLLYNSVEFIEVYCASAKAGLVVAPVSWRYIEKEIEYVVNNSDAKAMIVHEEFADTINTIRPKLEKILKDRFIVVGNSSPKGYIKYEDLIKKSPDNKPNVKVGDKDTWVQIYTSGITGLPKGVVRSHESYVAFFLINSVEFGFSEKDYGMIVMPLFHVNSTFYGLLFLYTGASLFVGRDKRFDPVDLLDIFDREKITFTSLIPTHYSLILEIPEKTRRKFDTTSLRKLLCSSAPVRSRIKRGILKCFPGVELYEAYGSTEAGLVTILKPEDQLRKIGSMGRECMGADMIKLLDNNGHEVGIGKIGELYSKGPMMFDEYYKMPEKTEASFRGEFFSAGDLVKRDEEGYYYIVDRKDNMIITGGEHVYPSELEEILSRHSKVRDVAVIGLPDDKWGEIVTAVIALKDRETISEKEIIEWCRDKMTGYKKPKRVMFINYSDIPRTATGKILHRELRERFAEFLQS